MKNKAPHKYKGYTSDKLEEHFSNFLMDSWSFSKVNTFARNEKAFEMSYIYNIKYKRSATEVAGSAYHKALQHWFEEYKKGTIVDIADLQSIAFTYIDEIWANDWKIMKTTPTVEDCRIKATATVNSLLRNFYAYQGVYTDDIKEVISVEQTYNEWLTINGVDIPLPCHGKQDLLIETMDGKIALIDHKSKTSFSDEKEMKFSVGKQAITYYNLHLAKTGEKIDEVWFVENKISENRDKSAQLIPFKIILDDSTIRLYEAMLYEPLKRMIQAVSDPDYVYIINESDNFVDKAEIYDFWARTMLAEIDDFNIQESKKELIGKRLKKVRDASLASINPKIISNFKKYSEEFITYDLSGKDMTREQKIEHVLRTLGITVQVAHTFKGYSSDTFLVSVSAGTNISSITRFKLDIAAALDVPSIRMYKDLYVHDGKAYVAIEALKQREEFLFFEKKYSSGYKIPLGIDNFSHTIYWDMNNPSTPHVLVCGSTGSGKSVFLISTLEFCKIAGIDNIIILDPKHEFKKYNSHSVQVYNSIEDIEAVMEILVEEMNANVKNNAIKRTVIIFDEFADAVAASRKGPELDVYETVVIGMTKDGRQKTKREKVKTKKSLEENMRLLGQKGRSTGVRIVAATQRASVKVISGDAKVNFPVQICFKVPKEVDSKVVIDEAGAESLAGKGDGLIKSPEYNGVVRFQAFYKE